MAFFNEFPFTRTYDSDLGWIIRRIQEVAEIVDNYVSLNSIQFADPINWDITAQYPRLTIVLDSNGGAYISRQPVPAGVPLTNDGYWTEIYNTASVIDSIRVNVAHNNGELDTASELIADGNLFWFRGDLYFAIGDIAAGSRFIEGSNCRRMTVDEKINLVKQAVTDAIAQEAAARESSDTELGNQIEQETNAREAADSELGNQIAQEATARENADDEIWEVLHKTSENLKIVNALDYGVIGDGITDDTPALQSWLNLLNGEMIGFLPSGNYAVSNTLIIPNRDNISIIGTDDTTIIYKNNSGDVIRGGSSSDRKRRLSIRNISIKAESAMSDGAALHLIGYKNYSILENIKIGDYGSSAASTVWDGIVIERANVFFVNDVTITALNDGIRVSDSAGYVDSASSDVFISNTALLHCAVGLHTAGGFGGLYVHNSLIFGGTKGYLQDNAVCSAPNREIFLSDTLCIDGCDQSLVEINETGNGAYINIDAFLSGAGFYADPSMWQYAGNVKILSCPLGYVKIGNASIKASKNFGLFVNDETTNIVISDSALFTYNEYAISNPAGNKKIINNGAFIDNVNNFYNVSPSIYTQSLPISGEITGASGTVSGDYYMDSAGTMFFNMKVSFTSGASGEVYVSGLPTAPKNDVIIPAINISSGIQVRCLMNGGNTAVRIAGFDGGAAAATGQDVIINGSYRTQ